MIRLILDFLGIVGVIFAILFVIVLAGRGCYLEDENSDRRNQEWLMACIEHCPPGTNVDANRYQGACVCESEETTTITTTGKAQ